MATTARTWTAGSARSGRCSMPGHPRVTSHGPWPARDCGRPGGPSSARSAGRRGRCTARPSCAPVARSSAPTAGLAAAGEVLVAALDAAIGRDPAARQGDAPARRRCSTRSCRRSRPGGPRWRPDTDAADVTAAMADGRRGRGPRDDPDARHEGPGVVSRRAVDRPPGSRGDVVGPAVARAGRRGRGPLADRPGPATGPADDGAHHPRRARRVPGRGDRAPAGGRADLAGRLGHRRPGPIADNGRGLSDVPLRSTADWPRPWTARDRARGARRPDGGAGRRGGRRDLRGAGAVRARPGHRRSGLRPRRGGASADEAILRATSEQADVLAAVDDDYFRERAADVRDVGRRVAAILPREPSGPTCGMPDGIAGGARGRGPRSIGRRHAPAGARGRDRPGRGGADWACGDRRAGARDPAGAWARAGVGERRPGCVGLDGAVDGSDGSAVHGAVHGRCHRARAGAFGGGIRGVLGTGALDPRRRRRAEAAGPPGRQPRRHGRRERGLTARGGGGRPRRRRGDRARPDRAAVPGTLERRRRSASSGRPTPASSRRWAIGRSCSGRSTSAATSPPSGSRRSSRRTPPWGFAAFGWGCGARACWRISSPRSLEAAAGRELRVMLPMVATREELDAAREQSRGGPRAARLGWDRRRLVGAAWRDDRGALGRDHGRCAGGGRRTSSRSGPTISCSTCWRRTGRIRNSPTWRRALQPAVLRLIDGVVRAAHARGRHVAVCGEAAADPGGDPVPRRPWCHGAERGAGLRGDGPVARGGAGCGVVPAELRLGR